MEKKRLAIVMPCYNESKMLEITIPKITSYLNEIVSSESLSSDSFIVFVDDGSEDHTWDLISKASEKYPGRVHGIRLALNAGHQAALMCGLNYAAERCDVAISMDADLQDDLDAIPQMLEQFRAGKEIVYGVKESREKVDGFFKRTVAVGFYKLMKGMGVELVNNHADFRLMSKAVLANLSQFGEVNIFLRGLAPFLHKSTGVVSYKLSERAEGETKYSLQKMLSLAWNGITSFSIVPIRLITMAGISVFLVSVLMALYSFGGVIIGRNCTWVGIYCYSSIPFGWLDDVVYRRCWRIYR